jgi:hypothetical protein
MVLSAQPSANNNAPCEKDRGERTLKDTRQVKIAIGAMGLAAAGTAGYAGFVSHNLHPYYAAGVLVLAAATSRMRVKLPGINGNMSVNLPFLLTAVLNLSAVEAAVVACVSTAVQCAPKRGHKVNSEQMVFNVSMMAFASSLASLAFHFGWLRNAGSVTAGLLLAVVTMFLGQTLPVSAIVAVSEGKSTASIWWNMAELSFPYYVVSAGVTSLLQAAGVHFGWGLTLGAFPVMYAIHRSYKRYFAGIESTSSPRYARAAGVGA